MYVSVHVYLFTFFICSAPHEKEANTQTLKGYCTKTLCTKTNITTLSTAIQVYHET